MKTTRSQAAKLAGSLDDKLAEIQAAAPQALAWITAPPDQATARAALALVIDYAALLHVTKLEARDRRTLARNVGEILSKLPEFVKAARSGQRFEFNVRLASGRRMPFTTFADALQAS